MKQPNPTAIFFTLAMTLSMAATVGAQDITFNGQIRFRGELNGKDFNNSTEISLANHLRTRFNISIKADNNSSGLIQIQDYRVFGEETSTLKDGSADKLDLHQAYFKIDKLFGLPLSAKIGRQELAYGNQRIIGAVGWDNIGRSFDGIVTSYKKGKFKIDAFLTKEATKKSKTVSWSVLDTLTWQISNLDSLSFTDGKNFSGLWASMDFNIPGLVNNTHVATYYLLDRTGDTAINRSTIGLFSKGSYGLAGGITITQEVDLAMQTGSFNETTDIDASLLGVRLVVSLPKVATKPKIGFGYDLVSGEDSSKAGDNAFNTLYATNHKFYGFMDYFLNIPKHAKKAGLIDVIGTFGFTPIKGLTVNGAYHMLTTDQPVNGSNDLGTELDFTANIGFRKGIGIVAGYSIFTPGTIFKSWEGSDPSSWAFLMVIYNF